MCHCNTQISAGPTSWKKDTLLNFNPYSFAGEMAREKYTGIKVMKLAAPYDKNLAYLQVRIIKLDDSETIEPILPQAVVQAIT